MIFSLLIGLGFLLLTAWRPALGTAFLSFVLPGYLWRFEISGIPTTLLEIAIWSAFIGALIAFARKAVPRPELRRVPRYVLVLVFAWGLAWLSSTLLSTETRSAFGALKAWWFDAMLYGALVFTTVRTDLDRHTYLKSLVLSAAVVAIAGLYQEAFVRSTLQAGRLSSFFSPVANYAAMYLVPLSILGAAAVTLRLLSRWWWVFLVPSFLAIAMTVSYGGYLAAFVGGLVIWTFMPRSRARTRAAFIGLIGCVIAGLLLMNTTNFTEHFGQGRSSGEARKEIWVTSWALIKQHPLFGVGPNAFQPAYRAELPKHYFPPLEWDVAQPHNLYLALWLELGLLGLLAFLAGMTYWFAVVLKQTRRPELRAWAICSLAAMSTILVHGIVDTPLFKNDLTLILLAIMILPFLSRSVDGKPALTS